MANKKKFNIEVDAAEVFVGLGAVAVGAGVSVAGDHLFGAGADASGQNWLNSAWFKAPLFFVGAVVAEMFDGGFFAEALAVSTGIEIYKGAAAAITALQAKPAGPTGKLRDDNFSKLRDDDFSSLKMDGVRGLHRASSDAMYEGF